VPLGDDAITTEVAGVGGQSQRAELMTKCRGPAVRCPRCKLLIAPRMPTLSPRHCPRCLARRRIVVELELLPSQCPAQSAAPGNRSELDGPEGLGGGEAGGT
jgi:hypothetical protein